MYLKRFIAVSACVAILLPSFASAGDGSEAAKADSGSSFGDKNAGHGLSGPSAVRGSQGLKKNSAILSAAPVKKNQTAKVPAPGKKTSYGKRWLAIPAAFLAAPFVGLGIGMAVGGPAGAGVGALFGTFILAAGAIIAIGASGGGDEGGD